MHSTLQSLDKHAAIKVRLLELWERTGDAALQKLANGQPPRDSNSFASEQDRSDWLSTCLMETYKNTGDAAVFALLFELNRQPFLVAIQGQLRRTSYHIDAQDVLQEVFLNIYRYPHRFHSDRPDAFRNWGHRIVRNTLLKFLRGENRLARQHSLDDDESSVTGRDPSPERVASNAEGAQLANCAYLMCLQLYLVHFGRLSRKEQQALTMVEIEGRSYRDAAERLGLRLENLKMVIFRGRRKIFRGMGLSLHDLAEGVPSRASRIPPPVVAPATGSATSLSRPLVDGPEPAQDHACCDFESAGKQASGPRDPSSRNHPQPT